MHAQLIPTTLCEEATRALADLLEARVAGVLDDGYFARDWAPLWDELARDGWTAVADRADGQFSLLDLTTFAQVWGRYLIPLPFVPTLAARRHLMAPPGVATRLTYAAAEPGATLVPHGPVATSVLTGHGLTEMAALAGPASTDSWAASAPVTVLAAGRAPADGPAARDAAILAAAEAVGAAAEVLRRSVAYAKVREQFGQPVGRFQAVKHRLANMHCSVELASSALAWACFEPDESARALRAALAGCLRVAEQAVQVHGGIGYTWEAAPHRFYRHIMAMRRIVVAGTGSG
jgi:alkylation response protein AidB-like acyl-CoA dehydrogenase